MSIVDAIEKAKRLAQERDTATPPRLRRKADADAAEVQTRPARTSLRSPTPSATPTPGLREELPRVPFDAAVCGSYRVIAPGVDASLMQNAASAYRMLRTRILQRCRNNGWSTLGVTSPGPGEGKTVTALNLAISIAREGNNDVFLIDLDMRNPSVCRYLGVSPPLDVSSYFRGGATASDVLFTVGIDNLVVAGSNMPVPHASELLASGKIDGLIQHIREISTSPLILFDLPPAVNTDDALVVAPRVDAIMLVASEGKTRRDGLGTALGLLSEFTLAGVVLNQSTESIGSDYYGAQ